MTYYKGRTVEEAVRNAVRGIKPEAKQQPGARNACLQLRNDVNLVSRLVSTQRDHMKTLQTQIDSLRHERAELFVHLAFDLALIALPIAKVLRILRLIDRLAELINTARAADQIEAVIAAILDVIGILDGARNLMRLGQLPDELRDVRNQIDDLRSELSRAEADLRRILDVYTNNGCALLDPDRPIV